jgi:hypothetical protein
MRSTSCASIFAASSSSAPASTGWMNPTDQSVGSIHRLAALTLFCRRLPHPPDQSPCLPRHRSR